MVFRQRLKRALQKKKGWDKGSDLSDGQWGLDYCLLHPPDLLLVDLNLPRRHGRKSSVKSVRVWRAPGFLSSRAMRSPSFRPS